MIKPVAAFAICGANAVDRDSFVAELSNAAYREFGVDSKADNKRKQETTEKETS